MKKILLLLGAAVIAFSVSVIIDAVRAVKASEWLTMRIEKAPTPTDR